MGTAWNGKAEKQIFVSRAVCRFSRSRLVVPLRKGTRERHGGAEMPPPMCLSVQVMGTAWNGKEPHGTTKRKQRSPANPLATPHQINTPSALITPCYIRACVIIKWNNRGLSYAQKRFIRKVGKRLAVAQSCRTSQAFCRRVPVCKARPKAGEQGRRAGVGWRYARAADLSGSHSAAAQPQSQEHCP